MNEKDTDVRLSVQSLRLISSLERRTRCTHCGQDPGFQRSLPEQLERHLTRSRPRSAGADSRTAAASPSAAAEDNSSLEHTKAEKLSANQERETAHWPSGGRFWQCSISPLGSQTTNVTCLAKQKWMKLSFYKEHQWATCTMSSEGRRLRSYLSNSKKFLRLPVHSNSLQGKLGKNVQKCKVVVFKSASSLWGFYHIEIEKTWSFVLPDTSHSSHCCCQSDWIQIFFCLWLKV